MWIKIENRNEADLDQECDQVHEVIGEFVGGVADI
jgi:hypothetical protein